MLDKPDLTDAMIVEQLRQGWHLEHDEQIQAMAARVEELGRLAAAQRLPVVLCHADIHAANLLVDRGGRLFVVDWDDAIRAPRERDLMFVLGAAFGGRPVTGRQEALFWQGYGPADVNWPALAYYRYERAITDIDEFARAVLLRDDLSEAAKQSSDCSSTWAHSARRCAA
jgi:spectinomycin phosphotransferase